MGRPNQPGSEGVIVNYYVDIYYYVNSIKCLSV